MRTTQIVILTALVLTLSACSSVYYNTMERFGYEKRDILVSRVENARDAQADAQETFANALEQFQSVVNVPESELSRTYNNLSRAYDQSKDSADRVSQRIRDIETVARDLFREWERELREYSSDSLRRQSEQQLRDTERQYDTLIQQMRRAESRMEPVLTAFNDQVLFLKHNLNAQAIGALRGELGQIESDVSSLISQMQEAIAESEAFIARFRSE
ncbi:MAG: DUF2959 domain-containing protein [Aliidiomarina sp.]|uniref:DUF2959 domain-containing protein n=1 Tax=Aliidiomarina sp. TaxID=1872439 RepID=UPI0025B915B4|nr:DUF2959 domain-containing protein [Aliidiomarina sp.]MCH8500966.1 DUF2959 domain-containing protein [Aliidiomarina sp.]